MSSFLTTKSGDSIYKNVNEEVERDYFVGLIEANAKPLVDSDNEDEDKSYMPFFNYLMKIRDLQNHSSSDICKLKKIAPDRNRIDIDESVVGFDSDIASTIEDHTDLNGKRHSKNLNTFLKF